jgi:hypothetical protein
MLYVFVMMIGNIIIPVLIAVLIYQLLKKTLPYQNKGKAVWIHVAILLILYPLGLVAWSILDVLLGLAASANESFFSAVTSDFLSQFRSFVVIAFLLAVLIPLVDRQLTF